MKIMSLLTEDMSTAINKVNMSEQDKILIESILYQERQNKERTWDSDAEKYVMKLIDENATEVIE